MVCCWNNNKCVSTVGIQITLPSLCSNRGFHLNLLVSKLYFDISAIFVFVGYFEFWCYFGLCLKSGLHSNLILWVQISGIFQFQFYDVSPCNCIVSHSPNRSPATDRMFFPRSRRKIQYVGSGMNVMCVNLCAQFLHVKKGLSKSHMHGAQSTNKQIKK